MPQYSKSQIKKKRKDDLVLAKRRIGDPRTPEEVEKITKIDRVLSSIREEEQLGEEIEEIEKARKAGKAPVDADAQIQEKLNLINQSQERQYREATGRDAAEITDANIEEISQWCQQQKAGLVKELICNPGKHDEVWIMPKVPLDEETTEKRISALEETAEDKGAAFEAKAARYNLNKGHLQPDQGGNISRNLKDSEKGQNGNAQKIMLKCRKCPWEREIDHVFDEGKKRVTVEVKNKKSTKGDVDQMRENAWFAKKNSSRAVYKLPPNRHSDKERIERVFGEEGASVEVILIE